MKSVSRLLSCTLLGILWGLPATTLVHAQTADATAQPAADKARVQVSIPAQELSSALTEFSRQTRTEIAFTPAAVSAKRAPEVSGIIAPEVALARLIDGQGLKYRRNADGVFVVTLLQEPAAGPKPRAEVAPPPPPPATEEGERTEDEIITVTGSRIPKSNTDTAILTKVLDRTEIDAAGTVDVGEMLVQLPGVDFDLSAEGTHTNTQNAGLNTITLRNLGGNRTLTLIDGRRAVSNSGNAQRVSTSTIPAGFIERIEITTGGASAVYGSDAVAGVVNIIFDDDFSGLDMRMRAGTSEDGGEDEGTIEATWGSNFSGGRGNVMANLTWDKETEVNATDRSWAVRAVAYDAGVLETNLSGNLPGGRFEGSDVWNDEFGWHNDISLPPNGETVARDYSTPLDGFNLRPFQVISPPRERGIAALKSNYDFASGVRAFASVQYAWEETESRSAHATASSTTSFGPFDNLQAIGQMSATHPLIPAEVEATRIGTVSWVRRFNEVGQDTRSSDRTTLRSWAGLEGTAFGGGWDWEAYVGFGHFRLEQVRMNDLNFQNVQYALNIEADPASPGNFRCVNAAARADGCVPLNIFGIGSISAEAADYIRAVDHLEQVLKQKTAAFNIVGELFDLPAGPLAAAFGMEYRKEEQATDGDPVTQTGNTGYAEIPDLRGTYDVVEAFAEFNLPLLADRPFAHRLSADAAVRFADYSQENVGTVASWKIGGSWAPVRDIRFRGQFARAQRAPDITELFSELRGDFDTADDPCDGVTAASTGPVAQNCRAIAAIQAVIGLNGVFDQDTTSLFAPNGGNLALKEETADTVTAGIVFTPLFMPNFSAVIDYYDIKVKDAIGSVDTQTVLDLCYNAANFPDNVFCNVISRGGDGQISRIVNQQENLNELCSSGIDTTLNLDFAFERLIGGAFDLQVIYSYIDKLEQIFVGPTGAATTDVLRNEVGISPHQARITLGWRVGDWRLRWRTRYLGSALDDNTLSQGDPDYFKVGSWTRHDLYAQYDFGRQQKMRFFAGINNVFHDYGPFLPSGLNSGGARNYNSAYDTIGRFAYAGLRVTW